MTKEQKILLLFVLAIAASSATFYVVKQKSSDAAAQPASAVSENAPAPAAQAPVQTAPVAQNKTFKETLKYKVPDDYEEDITVTVVLDPSNTITDVLFSYNKPNNKQSAEYLGNFLGSFSSSLLVGQKIGAAKLSKVGGASLTTAAFNQALTTINTKASL